MRAIGSLLSDRFGDHRLAIEKAIKQRQIDQPTAVSHHFTQVFIRVSLWEVKQTNYAKYQRGERLRT